MKENTVIINAKGQFLLYDRKSWGTTDNQFLTASEKDAIRIAKRLSHRPVYVVTDYGYEGERWQMAWDDGYFRPCEPLTRPEAA